MLQTKEEQLNSHSFKIVSFCYFPLFFLVSHLVAYLYVHEAAQKKNLKIPGLRKKKLKKAFTGFFFPPKRWKTVQFLNNHYKMSKCPPWYEGSKLRAEGILDQKYCTIFMT